MSHSSIFEDGRTVLAEVINLSLTFQVARYGGATVRDRFVEAVRGPKHEGSALEELCVLNNISFNINEGDRIGILGVNGAGKTTLCRCLAGTYNPTRGAVRRHGRVRGVFDTAIGIYPNLTGRENARLLMHFLYPECVDQHAELVEEALEFSELGKFLDYPYRTYSNGMQARLCLSLISCRPSDLLILDEVFDGADRFFREKISRRILSIIEKSGAVVFVSHSAEQIFNVCNRVLLLEHGEILFDGDVGEALYLYSHSKPRETDAETGLDLS